MDKSNSDRDSREPRGMHYKTDEPPNSRLFVIAHKGLNEEDFRKAFVKFGNIEEIWVVKDKRTGENKGVTYIKFSKTSEAASALEHMNGTTIGDSSRSIKVVVASSREQGSKRDSNEDERAQRLFVLVAKTSTVSELEEYFNQFGDVDYINIIKDKETRENRGYAYVKYRKFSHAADAYEKCDRKYKAVFAEPRRNPKGGGGAAAANPAMNAYLDNRYGMRMDYQNVGGYMQGGSRDGSDMGGNMSVAGGGGGGGYGPSGGWSANDYAGGNSGGGGGRTRLRVVSSSMVNEDQLWKLFDIIPGLDYCQLVPADQHSGRSIGTVVYNSPEKAAYASEKLHGFEYPPGFRLIVKLDDQVGGGGGGGGGPAPPDQPNRMGGGRIGAGNGGVGNSGGSIPKMSELCSVPLPECKPLADIDSDVGARCFIVCTPPPPPLPILKDIFCRFGTLIEVYILPNRNCGYARFASKESANNAIQTLHGAEIYGGRIKVMEAEEREDPQRKRAKFD